MLELKGINYTNLHSHFFVLQKYLAVINHGLKG